MLQADPQRARELMATVDPQVARSMFASTERSPYSRPIPGAGGVLWANTRDQTLEFQPYPEGFGGPAQYDPSLQGQVSYARGAGTGAEELQ